MCLFDSRGTASTRATRCGTARGAAGTIHSSGCACSHARSSAYCCRLRIRRGTPEHQTRESRSDGNPDADLRATGGASCRMLGAAALMRGLCGGTIGTRIRLPPSAFKQRTSQHRPTVSSILQSVSPVVNDQLVSLDNTGGADAPSTTERRLNADAIPGAEHPYTNWVNSATNMAAVAPASPRSIDAPTGLAAGNAGLPG